MQWKTRTLLLKTLSTGTGSQVKELICIIFDDFYLVTETKVLPGVVLCFCFGYSTLSLVFYLDEDY